MEKFVSPNAASSPVALESSPVVKKNDSFLEDVGLIPCGRDLRVSSREAERNVTRRTTSPIAGPSFAAMMSRQEFEEKTFQDAASVKGQSVTIRSSRRQELGSGDRLQSGDSRAATAAKESGRGKPQDGRPCSQEIKAKSKHGEPKASESRSKLQNDKSKVLQQERKLSGRRSSGSKDKEKSLEVSEDCKHSTGRSKQGNPPVEAGKDHQRRSDGGAQQKIEAAKEVPESVALLSAIKEIVSTYTKEEGIKISKMMSELHILGQASIIKNFISQTDEIRKAREDSGEYRALLEQNRILLDNFELIRSRYEAMRRENEEMERVKEENIALRLKLRELAARESS